MADVWSGTLTGTLATLEILGSSARDQRAVDATSLTIADRRAVNPLHLPSNLAGVLTGKRREGVSRLAGVGHC